MKKKFLTMMLFFAFLFAGVQNASAQLEDGFIVNASYVTPSQATILLADEMQIIEQNPVYAEEQTDHALYPHLMRQMIFYTHVSEQISIGDTIPVAIVQGVGEANDIVDSSGETFDPYIQEIVTLLSQ